LKVQAATIWERRQTSGCLTRNEAMVNYRRSARDL
jgi:hypothetical protein